MASDDDGGVPVAQPEEEKVLVEVVIPERGQFDGFWAAGRKWPVGNTTVEVTRKELEALKKKKGLAVLERGSAQPAPTPPAPVTPPALPPTPAPTPPAKEEDDDTTAARRRR